MPKAVGFTQQKNYRQKNKKSTKPDRKIRAEADEINEEPTLKPSRKVTVV